MTTYLKSEGRCPACDRESSFVARGAWLRDHFTCTHCGSIPRERALMAVIEMYFPQWRSCTIHESSPTPRGTSLRLQRECPQYIASQYFPGITPGTVHRGFRCEDMGRLTFANDSVDLHITQDVLEHVLRPADVFREIARTLRPGGAHIFTVPLVRRHQPSMPRVLPGEGDEIRHLLPPQYHGNPIDPRGSLVTNDWGFNITEHIHDACGLFTHIVVIDDLSRGIRADLIEVCVTTKPVQGGSC
jgi:hypothetical protein